MPSRKHRSKAISLGIRWIGAVTVLALLLVITKESRADLVSLETQSLAAAATKRAPLSPAAAETITATIKFAQDVYVVVPGNTSVTVDLVVQDASSLVGWEAMLVYDPGMLTAPQFAQGSFLSGSGRAVSPLGPREDTPGNLLIGAYTHGVDPGVSGTGVLARITFDLLETGQAPIAIMHQVLGSVQDYEAVVVQPSRSIGTLVDSGTPLALVVASFQAHQSGNAVTLTWQTVSEIANQGFNIRRSSTSTGPGLLVDYVPSQAPGSGQGADYQWLDTDVAPGETYYYWLEQVSTDGSTSMHGPVSISLQTPTAVMASHLVTEGASHSGDLWWLGGVLLAVLLGGNAYGAWRRSRLN
jgi:hypothetical protein